MGEVLASYEVQKREAIQREDYDTAEERRAQSESFRQQAYQRLNLSSLLEQITGKASSQSAQTTAVTESVLANEALKEKEPIRTKDTTVVVTYSHSERDHNHHDNQDNRPLPALVASSNSEEQPTRPATPPDTPTLPSGPEALSKKTAQEAAPIIEAFGLHTVTMLLCVGTLNTFDLRLSWCTPSISSTGVKV